MEGLEQFWKIAVGAAGLASVASFVLWSLYKQWLKLPVFSTLNREQQYRLLRLFLILTFLFAALGLASYVFLQLNETETKTAQSDLSGIKIEKIDLGEVDVNGFSAVANRSDDTEAVSLKFQSNQLGLNFEFQTEYGIYPDELLNALIQYFSIKDHIDIELAQFPTGTKGGFWYQDWKILLNGELIGSEYAERNNKTLREHNVNNGDSITLRLEWGMGATVSTEDGGVTGENQIEPPKYAI